MIGIHKAFGSTQALAGVDLSIVPGEVLALVGENGAGKSTLMKVLSGAHAPDKGSMTLEGEPFRPGSPHEAREKGVAMIYQELALAPHLSVQENIFLGRETSRFGILERRQERDAARRALQTVGHADLPLNAKVAALSPALRQMVEIARAIASEAKVLVMDEPTSSLGAQDMERLFRVIADLKSQGVSIIYISHFLEEVAQVADRVVVLRDGRSVGGGSMSELTIDKIIRLMVGREIESLFPRVDRNPGETLLEVENLSGIRLPRGASFRIRRGEVVGIAGLVGAGRTELLRALFGLDAILSGEVRLGVSLRPLSKLGRPRERWKNGVGFVSEDRKEEGLAVRLSVAENLSLTRLSPYTRGGAFLPWKRRGAVSKVAERMRIVCDSVDQSVASLSGGNQQKVALARLLHHDADLFLLDEPTRGIDVGSKAQIYELIGEAAAAQKAVLMVSSYLPELFGVCDRIAVMRKGTLSEARPTEEWTEEEVMRYATSEG
jgi:ribose transport system ATP-binding protein